MLPVIVLCQALLGVPLSLEYSFVEERTSWQPVDPKDVSKAIEEVVLETLLARGRFAAIPKSSCRTDCKPPDYVLTVRGRMIDEAETHTVVLDLRPGAESDLPSLATSASAALRGKKRPEIVAAIRAEAREAGRKLSEWVEREVSRPENAKLAKRPEISKTLPWTWPEVRVPNVETSKAAKDLYAKDSGIRSAALRELASAARVTAQPRHVLESCLLSHPDEEVRRGCVDALRPFARRIPATQEVVIQAFRKEKDDRVREALSEEMSYFAGISRDHAVAAWLESLSRCSAPGPIAQLGPISNLEWAVQSCLRACGERPKYQRSKATCIEHLEPMSTKRRREILAPHIDEMNPESPFYLEGAGDREGSTGTDWQRAVEAALEGASEMDNELEEALWRRYQRSLSSFALEALAEQAPPSEKLANRLLEAVSTAGNTQALYGLRRVAKADDALRSKVVNRLSGMLATQEYPKSLSKNALEGVLREIERAGGKP